MPEHRHFILLHLLTISTVQLASELALVSDLVPCLPSRTVHRPMSKLKKGMLAFWTLWLLVFQITKHRFILNLYVLNDSCLLGHLWPKSWYVKHTLLSKWLLRQLARSMSPARNFHQLCTTSHQKGQRKPVQSLLRVTFSQVSGET